MSARLIRAIGLMNGTSLDGIDAALIEADGEQQVIAGPALTSGVRLPPGRCRGGG